MTIRLEWTESGKEYTNTGKQRLEIEREIDNLKWHDLEPGLNGPMSPMLAIKAILVDLPSKHMAIAWNGALQDRYGFYGIRTRYKSGVGHSYWLDYGVGCACVCHRYTPDGQV